MLPAMKESGYKVYRTYNKPEEEKEANTLEEEYEQTIKKANEIIKKKMDGGNSDDLTELSPEDMN